MTAKPKLRQWTELVTPERASEILSRNHKFQRHPSKKYVTKFAAEMKAGKWTLSPQPIVITREGVLIDGQHRMMAVVDSGKAQEFSICEVPDESYISTIDRGHIRTHGHVLEMAGVVDQGMGKRFSAIIRAMYSMDCGLTKPSDFEANSMAILEKSGPHIRELFSGLKYRSTLPAPVLAMMAYAYPCNPSLVSDMCRRLIENDGLSIA